MTGLPRGLTPMLATAGPLPPEDGRWSYEVKWDGVRALVAVTTGGVRITSRTGQDVTATYPELAGVSAGGRQALLDGEVVALDAAGRPDFGRLQARMGVRRPSPALVSATPVQLLLFDVLHVDDDSLLDAPQAQRRAVLEGLGTTGAAVPPAFPADGATLLESTRQQGLEGVVAKRGDGRYRPGRRSEDWVKVKNVRRQSAVVVGWKGGEGGRASTLGSLLLAVPGPSGELAFAGHVGTGFSGADLRALRALLAERATGTAACPVPAEHARSAQWVRPDLVVDVDLTAWTRQGRLRHPSYRGLRPDLRPADVVREEAP